MRRREFIALVGGAVAAMPAAASAQRSGIAVVGVLMGYAESDSEAQAQIAAFRDGLQKLGWIDGHNIRIDTRWTTPTDAACKVICATQKQLPRPRSTKVYHSFYFERPQARRTHRARESAELLKQARGRTSGRYAPLL